MRTAVPIDDGSIRACERLVIDSAAHNDAGDWRALAGLYTDNARLTRPSGDTIDGREAIEAAYSAGSSQRRTRHVCANIRIDALDDDTATGLTTVLVFAWTADADREGLPTVDAPVLGEFEDRFARTPDGWRIDARVARLVARVDPG